MNDRMGWALENAHLISPATSVGAMAPGFGVALSVVTVDPKADTYPVGNGKHGLSKTVLQKIGAALGVSWDPHASGRLDDRRHPHYCAWRAVGTYKSFDGTELQLVAEKEMDLRAGSPQLVGKTDRQIAEMRLHLQSHCETKAQLRALRSAGIKTSYTVDELGKPFVAARLYWTGETSDPALKREFARMNAEAFLNAKRSLYSSRPETTARPQSLGMLAAPPVGTNKLDPDDEPE